MGFLGVFVTAPENLVVGLKGAVVVLNAEGGVLGDVPVRVDEELVDLRVAVQRSDIRNQEGVFLVEPDLADTDVRVEGVVPGVAVAQVDGRALVEVQLPVVKALVEAVRQDVAGEAVLAAAVDDLAADLVVLGDVPGAADAPGEARVARVVIGTGDGILLAILDLL